MDLSELKTYVRINYGPDSPSAEDCNDFCRRLAPVKFSTDKTGVSKVGKVTLHDDYVGKVSEGDVWFCELNTKANRWYIGKPIQKVDAQFMMGLAKDQMQDVADAVWAGSKDAVIPYLEQWFADEKGLMSVEEHREDIEALKAMLTEENESLKTAHAEELERLSAESAEMRNSYDERIADLEREKAAAMGTIDGLHDEIVSLRKELEMARTQRVHVLESAPSDAMMRTDESTIEMRSLDDGNYMVTVSADGRKMIICRDPHGRAVCESGAMHLCGLEKLSPFAGVTELRYTYDAVTGAYSVDLGGRASA